MSSLTNDRVEELRAWTYKAWSISWRELAPKSNSRAQFFKYVKQANFDDEKLASILLSIQAQTKHWRRQNKIERVIGIPCLSAWFKQERYDDEFIDESAMEMVERENLKTCIVEGCIEEVHGSMFKHCTRHIPNAHSDLLAKAWKSTGINIRDAGAITECRKRLDRFLGKTVKKYE